MKEGGNVKKGVSCYGCGKTGHFRSQCPNKKRDTTGNISLIGNSYCLSGEMKVREKLCEQYGEFLSVGEICTNMNLKTNNKVVMLRDTGATQSCILKSALPNDFVSKGDSFILLGGFPCTVTSCPLEEVYLKSDQYNGKFKFAIVDRLPVEGIQVIIGNELACGSDTSKSVQLETGLGEDCIEVNCMPVSVVTRSQKVVTGDEEDLGPVDLDSLPEILGGNGTVKVGKQVLCSREEFIREQEKDVSLESCREHAVKVKRDTFEIDFTKSVFIEENSDQSSKNKREKAEASEVSKCILVTSSCREFIMKEAHEGTWGRHLGISKIFKQVWKYLFWPTVMSEMRAHYKSCHTYQVVGKLKQVVPRAPFYFIPIVSEPG